MELWFEWEENNEEHLSFDDSDRFEEDSLCSWVSEPESLCGNWRGWKRNSQNGVQFGSDLGEGTVETLIEICARTVAEHFPFETVECKFPQIPEQLQQRIAFWSFPLFEEDIRLYSCLANGSPDKFLEGEQLLKVQAVKDVLQIGFHLSGTVHQPHSVCQSKGIFNVAVTFDRGHITSCNCTCDQTATWCSHVIALCLFRIHFPKMVCLRAPVSEYLSRLRRDQLQKFAQYLITELPQQLLPTAQRLLDELLSSQESTINSVPGAPDPTAGPSATDHSKWCLDESSLHENIKKMLVRFCGPSPLVFSDVNALFLANTAPPTAAEWSNILRPLKGREPEGMWNLLSIVRELFSRGDMNAVNLLVILTEECLANDQVLIWWYDSRSQASGNSPSHSYGNNYRGNTNTASTEATKHACAGFCDELVALWRLAALNPKLSNDEREEMKMQLQEWHQKTVDKGQTGRGGSVSIPPAAISCFPGFLAAIEACSLNWKTVDIGLVPKERNHEPQLSSALKSDTGTAQSCGSTETGLHENVLSSIESPIVSVSPGTTEESISSSSADEHNPIFDAGEDLQVLCARMEALHVHGYSSLAGKLAVKLAENILSDDRNVSSHFSARSKRLGVRMTSFTNTILLKAGFLCNVLAEDLHCHHLAFKVCMLGLEMPRQPAKSKALEVKLLHQESELVSLLKKLPLGPAELAIVKEKAGLLHQGELRRGEAVLPIMLASFIFDILRSSDTESKAKRQAARKLCETTKEDEELGFKAALYAIGMKGNAFEHHYPMLCEGTRQQRGDLALALLVYSRDDPTKIRQIMDVILDQNRYDLPSAAGTPQDKKRVERSDSKDNKDEGKESEASGTNVVKGKATIVLPNRKASHQSSSTSDSGTDSSCKDSSGIDRYKLRGGNERSYEQRLLASNASLSLDEESGNSSGVDTDSVPVPHLGLAAYKADLQGSKQNDKGILHSHETLSKASPNCEPTQCDPFINSSQHYDAASNPSSVLRPDAVPQSREDLINVDHLHNQVPIVEDSDTIPPNQNTQNSGDPNLFAPSVDVPRPCEGNAPSQRLESVHFYCNSNDREAFNSCSSDNPELSQRVILANHGLSSEGDVSDIEADFDECHSRVQQELFHEIESSHNLVNEGETGEVGASPSSGAVDNELSETSNVFFQVGNKASSCSVAEGESCIGGDAVVIAPSEVLEEQSSESGSRGSVSAGAEDTNRSRRRRGRRRRRGGKSALYQATEAEAHFMFELAKAVLSKAGGGNGTSVFTQATSSDTQAGAHRVLQLCAFEIGLFALGLHNRTSANWLSRTYSSHVSWISGQAMEIGHQAITLLLKRWEGNLTPSEVVSIADRASRYNDRAMVRAAAELGLSCLHMATTLNPGEIQRALSQCREEDAQLLEQACQAVESAARGGGVYPEVLFEVAKHWYHLHEKNQTNNSSASGPGNSESRSRSSLNRSSQSVASSGHSPPVSPFVPQVPQFTMPPCYPSIPPPLYTTPEQYVQQQMHQQVHQMMGHYPPYLPGASSGYRSYSQSRSLTGPQYSLSGGYTGPTPPPYQATNFNSSLSQHLNRVSAGQQGIHVSYHLNSAYRVGMLALEFLSRRTSDDRPNVKFSRNPNCSDDIRWLCSLSARLGNSHLQRFCVAALNAVASPFVLHDLALEAARHMARSNPAQLTANLRSPTISPLVQKSLTMYAQCVHYNLLKISQSEYDEFVELLRHARGAFCMAPGGMTQFNELLQSIRRGQPKKKELWQMIMSGLAKA